MEIYTFYVKQKSSLFPELMDKVCRISEVKFIDPDNVRRQSAVLYKIQYRSDDQWVTLKSPYEYDKEWFGFTLASITYTKDHLNKVIHNHFIMSMVEGSFQKSATERLSIVKMESSRNVSTFTVKNGDLIYWDSMIVQGYRIDDNDNVVSTHHFSVKVRQTNVEPGIDDESKRNFGVVVTSALNRGTNVIRQNLLNSILNNPLLFKKGKMLRQKDMDIDHLYRGE
jgi:hypothetical protein